MLLGAINHLKHTLWSAAPKPMFACNTLIAISEWIPGGEIDYFISMLSLHAYGTFFFHLLLYLIQTVLLGLSAIRIIIAWKITLILWYFIKYNCGSKLKSFHLKLPSETMALWLDSSEMERKWNMEGIRVLFLILVVIGHW